MKLILLMMKKNIFCICILLAGSHASFSQISFYVKPTLDTKSFISSTYGSLGTTVFSFSDDVAENPYFKVDNVMMFHHDNYQIGLYLGANFGDGKHLLEVGWNQDATGSMMRTSEMTYNKPAFPEDNPPVARYFDNGSSFASALFTQRFTIQHSFRINKNSEKNTRLYFNYGAGFIYNPSGSGWRRRNVQGGPSTLFESFGDSITGSWTYLDSTITMPLQRHIIRPVYGLTGFFSIGVMADFHSKKNKYLFSATLSYLQGFRVLESTTHEYFVNDNGALKSYSYETVSKGSGFYLQLSRRLTFYKLKKGLLQQVF